MSNPICYRRNFLKWTLLSAVSFLGACLADNKVQSIVNSRIIVVGAGIAGIAAAHSLQSRGANVVVLEAKPHIGGRLLTDYSLGAAFEVGAGWIHGPDGNPISTLAEKVKAKTFVTKDDSLLVYDRKGNVSSKASLAKLDDRFEALLKQVDDYVDADDLISLRDAIARVNPTLLKDPLINWALTVFTEFDTGGPIENLSAAYFDEDEAFEGDDVILINGYTPILTPLTEGLDIRLNTIVTDIEYKNQGVIVNSQKEKFVADYVICTVPLGILKAGKIAFHPPLPKSYQQSIGKIPLGNVTKVALQFPQAFWPLDTQYFGFQSEVKGKWPYFMNYRTFSEHNILVALSFGS
ncbi:MAG: FAD-dependent oxidoreductase [Spirulinaceae cyanobacterium]